MQETFLARILLALTVKGASNAIHRLYTASIIRKSMCSLLTMLCLDMNPVLLVDDTILPQATKGLRRKPKVRTRGVSEQS